MHLGKKYIEDLLVQLTHYSNTVKNDIVTISETILIINMHRNFFFWDTTFLSNLYYEMKPWRDNVNCRMNYLFILNYSYLTILLIY